MPTILVADDNTNIQKMIATALKAEGINVVAVGNGEAAVRKLPELRPDLVLADVFMPVRNGFEVCEFVKQDARFAGTPVILLVGAFDPLDEREVQRVAADGVLKKPFVPPDPLIAMVKSILSKTLSEVPVAAGDESSRAAAEPMPSPASRPAAPAPEFAIEPQPEPEDFAAAPRPVSFNEGEEPLAFSELMQAPAAEAPAEPAADTGDVGAESSGDLRFWHSSVEEEKEEQEYGTQEDDSASDEPARPRQEDAAALRSLYMQVQQPDEAETPQPELKEQEAHEPAREDSPATPQATSSESIYASAPAPEPAAPEWPSQPDPPTPTSSPAANTPEFSTELPAEPEAVTLLEPDPAPTLVSPVQSFEAPQPADPAIVEQVTARVIERLQPQLAEIISRNVLKPVVESLVRRELEKQ